MKISIVINGTRGDVQPMLALADALNQKGHETILCAPPENQELIESYNCTFIPFGPNYKELFKNNMAIKGGATVRPSVKSMKKDTEDQMMLLPEMLKGSDLVLGVGFVLGVSTAAELIGARYRFVIFYPSILGTAKSDPFIYRMLFGFGRSMTNAAMKGFINKFRISKGLKPIKDVWSNWMGDEVIAACDKEINEVRKDVLFAFKQTGYMFLPSKQGLPEEVEKFIVAGTPPVFIGFGSNPIARPEKYSQLFNEVAANTGKRFIISKGWADLGNSDHSENILYIDELPYEILFPKLAAIVYHGGTGTMASAARAGIPQAAFPFMADQFENRKRIISLGIGPKTCDFKKMNVQLLSMAITECLSNENYKKNAVDLARRLPQSNGIQLTIQVIEQLMVS